MIHPCTKRIEHAYTTCGIECAYTYLVAGFIINGVLYNPCPPLSTHRPTDELSARTPTESVKQHILLSYHRRGYIGAYILIKMLASPRILGVLMAIAGKQAMPHPERGWLTSSYLIFISVRNGADNYGFALTSRFPTRRSRWTTERDGKRWHDLPSHRS